MTCEQINKRIAEVCGWTDIHESGPWHNHKLWGYPPETQGQGGNAYKYVPDYCADINAIREAETMLDENQYIYFMKLLFRRLHHLGFRYIWNAHANERAEAFLRALGKWDEQKERAEKI